MSCSSVTMVRFPKSTLPPSLHSSKEIENPKLFLYLTFKLWNNFYTRLKLFFSIKCMFFISNEEKMDLSPLFSYLQPKSVSKYFPFPRSTSEKLKSALINDTSVTEKVNPATINDNLLTEKVNPCAINDTSFGVIDRLGYKFYAEAIARVLKTATSPVCVGIYAR